MLTFYSNVSRLIVIYYHTDTRTGMKMMEQKDMELTSSHKHRHHIWLLTCALTTALYASPEISTSPEMMENEKNL